MVLLEIATKVCSLKNLAVFHLDHGLRKDSQNDFLFVQKICSRKNVQFFGEILKKFPAKNKESYWREKRRELSLAAAKYFEAKRILTAHHATDLVETMIFRLTKGTGVAGLAPFQTETKPFWNIARREIEAYAHKHKIKYIQDSSNEDEQFERNIIRRKVLPELRRITPNLEKVFIAESEIFRETAHFLEAELQTHFEAQSIPLASFLQLHPILQQEFLRRIARKTPSSSEINDCLKWLHNTPQGNSHKSIGNTKLILQQKKIHWD